MTKHNASNERIKRAYFVYLREAKGMSETSIDQIAKALDRFEVYTHHRDFKRFHIEQAKGFKQRLANRLGTTPAHVEHFLFQSAPRGKSTPFD